MKFFKKTDSFIVIGILCIGILLLLFVPRFMGKDSGKAEIYYKSKLVKTVELNTGKDETFSIPQNPHVVFHLYSDGSIRFEESNCPDKICIKAGKLRRVGESAACLPNGIILKIVPSKERSDDDLDMVVGK